MDGTLDMATERALVCEVLTTWSVSPDGQRARLGFAGSGGEPCRVDLPVEAVSGLLMTLPQVLQAGMRRRGDANTRMVQALAAWRLEAAAEPGTLILTLRTPDGFSVAFALAPGELVAMANAVQDHRPTLPQPVRVVN